MRRVLSILIIMFLILSGFGLTMIFDFTTQDAVAFQKVSGTIDTDQQWDSTNSPYYVTGDITILDADLIILPGTEISFNGSYKISVSSGNLLAIGSKSAPIVFDYGTGTPTSIIEVQQTGRAVLDWCVFGNASTAIKLIDSIYGTSIANCSFKNSCTNYFDLTRSTVNVTSSRLFNNAEFESNIGSNLGKIIINDLPSNDISAIYIQYYVNVYTVNGLLLGINDIDVGVSDTQTPTTHSNSRQGKSDSAGEFLYSPVTAVRINRTLGATFGYLSVASVSDTWDAKGPPYNVTGISNNQTTPFNASNTLKNSDLYIEHTFMFKYPPKIDNRLTSITQVKEDQKKPVSFSFHDNDDFVHGYDNLTINMTDQNGKGIYNDTGLPNTMDKWIYWENGILYLYRTIESPFTPIGPDDYKATVHEDIYITISDPFGLKDTIGPVDVEFINVPDKPVINGLPSGSEIVTVTEDIPKYIPITVSDNDNATEKIHVYSSSQYVDYWYNGTNNQKLRLLYENEFGKNDDTEEVKVYASDGCSERVEYTFVVQFKQTPDAPIINGTIPHYYINESIPTFELSLGKYALDPDPDDDMSTLYWDVTGLDEEVYGKQFIQVANDTLKATGDTPISFSLNPEIDIGGAHNPDTSVEEEITLWLYDQYDLSTSQKIKLIVNSTNQPPSLHKITKNNKKVTVIPDSGFTSDSFQFIIEYKDMDGEKGDAPSFMKVYIDGKDHDMIEQDLSDDNYKDGKIYYFNTSMSAGDHEHYFECSDSAVTTRFPLLQADPNIISQPSVEARIYILEKSDPDDNFIVRLAHTSPNAFADVVTVNKPPVEHEPDKDELNKTKGDICVYFQVNALRIDSILWAQFTVKFGLSANWDNNYNGTKWLRKVDLQFGYYTAADNQWTSMYSEVDTKKHTLKINLTPIPGLNKIFENIINDTDVPIFTVIGILDADDDGTYNAKDAFPLDPAASLDTDSDGSPDRWNTGKSAKDSTTGLYIDAFIRDPAASLDGDDDGCPDKWNTGKSQNDSTSDPKLTLDSFPDNPGACLDSDGDGMPDLLIPDRNTQPELTEDKDDDNDGMSDSWEDEWMRYALEHNKANVFDPTDPSDANKDFDGDGRKNIDEYREDSNPYKKDAEDAGIFSGSGGMTIIIIVIIIIIIIVLIIGFILRKRGKKEPEELPRGMGGPIPEVEGGEGPVPPGVEEYPGTPPETGFEEGFPSTEEEQLQIPEGGVGEGEMVEPEAGGIGEEGLAAEETGGAIAEEMGAIETPPEEPVAEAPPPTDEVAPSEPAETAPGTEPPATVPPTAGAGETTAATTEGEFTCPNCGTALTREMTECPGCKAPLMFD